MPRQIDYSEENKGTAIRVVRGKYKGRVGHLHKGLPETDDYMYVILSKDDQNPEAAKQIKKTSITFAVATQQVNIWEQRLLTNKKVEPHYQTFLNKLLEAEFEPTPALLACIWIDWKKQYKDRQDQDRSTGLIRVRAGNLRHPSQRKDVDASFIERFNNALSLMNGRPENP